jgi:hypothetical protein
MRRWLLWFGFYRDARSLGHTRRLARAWANYALVELGPGEDTE